MWQYLVKAKSRRRRQSRGGRGGIGPASRVTKKTQHQARQHRGNSATERRRNHQAPREGHSRGYLKVYT